MDYFDFTIGECYDTWTISLCGILASFRVNGTHYGFMGSGTYSSPTYYPYNSSTGDGQNPYHPGYYSSYRGTLLGKTREFKPKKNTILFWPTATNELQNLLNGSIMNSTAGQATSSLNSVSASQNAPYRLSSASPPDVISLDWQINILGTTILFDNIAVFHVYLTGPFTLTRNKLFKPTIFLYWWFYQGYYPIYCSVY